MTNITEMFNTESESNTLKTTITQLAEAAVIEEAELDRMKAELKDRKEKLDATKRTIAETLSAAGIGGLKLESGLNPSVSKKTKYFKKAGITDEQQQDWLKDNGLGDIIKPTVNYNTFQSTAKAFIEQGGKLDEKLFNISDELTVRMNGKSKFLENVSSSGK